MIRILRVASIVLSIVVALGWGWFVADQAAAASENTQQQILGEHAAAQVDPDPSDERLREKQHGKPHELVDDANDLLLRPFTGVVRNSTSDWTRRSVPALLALLTYGLGLATLARYLQTR
jgi:hypothetical protein